MNIQIYTDASVNVNNAGGGCGYAYIIKCYQFEYRVAGYVHHIDKIAKGELYAINDAVTLLFTKDLVPLTKVEIFTDSTEAIHRMKDIKHPYVFNLIGLALKNGNRPSEVFDLIELNHAKAHTGGHDDASVMNRWCDKVSKQHRKNKGSFKAIIYDLTDILL